MGGLTVPHDGGEATVSVAGVGATLVDIWLESITISLRVHLVEEGASFSSIFGLSTFFIVIDE